MRKVLGFTPKPVAWLVGMGVGWTLLTTLRLTLFGSSVNYFTNWDAILYSVFFILVPRELDFLLSGPTLHVGALVAILSTVIFSYGSTVFEDAIREHGAATVHTVNIFVHILPWPLTWLYIVRYVVPEGSVAYARAVILWGAFMPSLILPMIYMRSYDARAKYGTELPVFWIWTVSLCAIAFSTVSLCAWYRMFLPGLWAGKPVGI